MTRPASITLAKGNHDATCDNPERCLFEWYNWLTRDQHTDTCPPGVSPVLHAFGMRLNDALPDDTRQRLIRYLPNGTSPLAGTADDGKDETRSYMALDWLIRVYLPRWLDLVPSLSGHASAVTGLPVIADLESARAAGPVVRAARAAAWDAAGDAAWAAARAAVWAAAGDAALAAARTAAGDAARAAARAAVWAAAGDAALAAARTAAWDAARDAAGDALAPT